MVIQMDEFSSSVHVQYVGEKPMETSPNSLPLFKILVLARLL